MSEQKILLNFSLNVTDVKGDDIQAIGPRPEPPAAEAVSDPASLILSGVPVYPGLLTATVRNADNGVQSYTWFIGEQKIAYGDALYIAESMRNQQIRCQAIGDNGELIGSASVIVRSDYQSITREEHENSYIKQFGHYQIHSSLPCDRHLITTAGAWAILNRPGKTTVGGAGTHGGGPPDYFTAYLSRNGSEQVFANEKNFAVLVPVDNDNRLLVWGAHIPVSSPYPLQGIRAVYCNRHVFAFIYHEIQEGNYWLGAVGHASYGNTVPEALHLSMVSDPPVAIYATEGAFAVRTTAGKVYAWGHSNHGGTIDAKTQETLSTFRVEKIIANTAAFCALGENGQLACWGNNSNGGTIPAETLRKIYDDGGVLTAVAAEQAFCVITRNNRRAYCWGNASNGGIMQAAAESLAVRGNIVLCKAAAWAFTIVSESGQAESWGNASFGGKLPGDAGGGLNSESAVGEDNPSSSEEAGEEPIRNQIAEIITMHHKNGLLSNLRPESYTQYADALGSIQLYANDASFLLLSLSPSGTPRKIISWGYDAFRGLTPATKQILLASQIQQIVSTNGAWVARVQQGNASGCVIAWGSGSSDAGIIPAKVLPDLNSHSVLALYAATTQSAVPTTGAASSKSSLIALLDDGRYLSWGGVLPVDYLKSD